MWTIEEKRAYERKYYAEHPERRRRQKELIALNYPKRKAWRQKHYQDNKEKIKKYNKKYYEASRLKKYGLSLDEYNKLFQEQQGCCAICGRHQSEFKRRLDVDHNHITNEVRGLLCPRCNLILGHAFDNKELLKACIRYLSQSH